MDLLAEHRRAGRRFEVLGLVEEGDRITARLGVTSPEWQGAAEIGKAFTFRDDRIVRLDDLPRA